MTEANAVAPPLDGLETPAPPAPGLDSLAQPPAVQPVRDNKELTLKMPEWMTTQIKDETIRNDPALQPLYAHSQEDALGVLAKMNVSAQHLVGSRAKVPGADATHEQIVDFRRKSMAAPVTAEEYKLPDGTKYDEKADPLIRMIMHTLGLSQSDYLKVANIVTEFTNESLETTKTSLDKMYGADAEKIPGRVEAIIGMAPEGFKEELRALSANSPVLSAFFAMLAPRFGESVAPSSNDTTSPQNTTITLKQIESDIASVTAKKQARHVDCLNKNIDPNYDPELSEHNRKENELMHQRQAIMMSAPNARDKMMGRQ